MNVVLTVKFLVAAPMNAQDERLAIVVNTGATLRLISFVIEAPDSLTALIVPAGLAMMGAVGAGLLSAPLTLVGAAAGLGFLIVDIALE